MLQALRQCLAVFGCFLSGCVADTLPVASKQSDVPGKDSVVVSLAAMKASVGRSEDLQVLFSIANYSSETFTILPWATPLEAVLSADSFEVIYNGSALPYVGRIVKRAAPAASDYIHIAAGEKKTVTVNLSYAYELDAVGSYQVQLKTEGGKYRAHSHLLPVTSQSLVIERL